MVRPFWPGGDFESVEYSGKVVVDNPPFSIMTKILGWYFEHGVRFFLFANANTLFGLRRKYDLVLMPVNADVTYENGAKIRTAFVSNMEPGCVWTCTELRRSVMAASDEYNKAGRVTLPKYKMPANVWNAATIASHDVEIKIPSSEYEFIPSLESMRKEKKSIFGGGLLFSDRAASELTEARRRADEARRRADEARQVTWTLSDAERARVEKLNSVNVSRETFEA